MSADERSTIRDLLLAQSGLVFLPAPAAEGREAHAAPLATPKRGWPFVGWFSPPELTPDEAARKAARGLELELANLGYVLSPRLAQRVASCDAAEATALCREMVRALLAHAGGDQKHEPLFRKFPHDVPDDTEALWWKKVLSHYLQAEGQPCIFCGQTGTTHVLRPCRHVVCDRCFDGSSYSACPVCEHHVDRTSPFFLPTEPSASGPRSSEGVVFRRLDLGDDLETTARDLFTRLCLRTQAISPDDRAALTTLVKELPAQALEWIPPAIPVKENVALVFATLFGACDAAEVLPVARRHMRTATDVLRFIAVLSGTDGSLQPETRMVQRVVDADMLNPPGSLEKIITFLRQQPPDQPRTMRVAVATKVRRFKTARLPRPLRRALLAVLEGLPAASLTEDMLRHRSWWVWVGEFLHPHEYAARFPNVAKAFQIVRTKAPDGTPAPAFNGWRQRVESALREGDIERALDLLAQRPGELARHYDHLLRLAQGEPATSRDLSTQPNGDDLPRVAEGRSRVIDRFASLVAALSTPLLLTLKSHLPLRAQLSPVRVYWPKGSVGRGVTDADHRPTLSTDAIARSVQIIDDELLRRFGALPRFDDAVIDVALGEVIVPFNERTASRAALSLPRGSRLSLDALGEEAGARVMRLFLHWCEPERSGRTTDLDLSVGFYDSAWTHVGVCSYYQLKMNAKDGALIAQSAGDLQSAPWPDGASEFVDLHCDAARAAGIRYAVMVVNAYRGLPFSQLDRAFAGVMGGGSLEGKHFDPRAVKLRFSLQGEHGTYMPLVVDLVTGTLHWLDVHARGELELNNVANANRDITRICPALMGYFSSGTRPSMRDLGLLHAAARCRRVWMRGKRARLFTRGEGESVEAFHARLVAGRAEVPDAGSTLSDGPNAGSTLSDGPNAGSTLSDGPDAKLTLSGGPVLALLLRGDIDLPSHSSVYALFRERVTPTLAASDLLS